MKSNVFKINFFIIFAGTIYMGTYIEVVGAFSNPIDRIVHTYYDKNNIEVIASKVACHSYIKFVKDDKENLLLVKQTHVYKPYAIMQEMIGAWIAHESKIAANEVRIIPAHVNFPGKQYVDRPATLHTFVSGIPVAQIVPSIHLDIKQPMPNGQASGLSLAVIANMANHPSLSGLVALDTFIGNTDRNKKNYFYDRRDNKFIAIDFGGSFKYNLGLLACNLICNLLENKHDFSPKQLVGLRIYRNKLKHLTKKFTPQVVHAKVDVLAQQIEGFSEMHYARIKDMFDQNYYCSKNLVELLDVLLQMHE